MFDLWWAHEFQIYSCLKVEEKHLKRFPQARYCEPSGGCDTMRPYGTLRTLFENRRYWQVGLPREESCSPYSQTKPSCCTSGNWWNQDQDDALHQVQESHESCSKEVVNYFLKLLRFMVVF